MATKTTGRAASVARNATRVARTVSSKPSTTTSSQASQLQGAKDTLLGLQKKVPNTPVVKTEPSQGLKNLSIANSGGGGAGAGTTGPSTTPSTTPTTGPSDALKEMSIAISPVKRTLKGATAPTTPTYQAPAGPKTAAQFEVELGRSAQKEINSLNKYATEQINALKPAQQEAVRATQSVSTLTGLGGSSEANIAAGKTSAANEAENKLIRQETLTKVQGVLSKVASDAQTLAQSERTNFRLDETERIANEAAQRTKANENIATLGQSGVSADALAKNDPATYQALSESVGGEELLKAMFTLNRPQETILDKKIQGGKYMIAYKNPLDDKIRIETVDLGLPPEYNNTIDAGDRLLAIPDGWDGDPSKLVTINKGLTPSQASSGGGGGYGGGVTVSPAAQNIIDQVNLGVPLDDLIKGTSNAAQALRNEVLAGLNAQGGLTTKSADILAEGKDVVDRMIKNNAYKALGGYSTIFGGQYSTAFGDAQAQAGQLQAILARDNLGLLKGAMSDKDLAFIQSMSSGFEGEGTQSEAFVKERLEAIQTKLQKKLSTQNSTQSGTLTSPDGSQQVNVADLTPAQLQEAKDAGWK